MTFIDLDNVYNPESKEIVPWAQEIIEQVNSYTEFSQSGKGIHIYSLGLKSSSKCRKGNLEIYP